jgi:hypothetical protein
MSALPPDGNFCRILVSIGTTPETFSTFLCEHGLDVGPERIVISDRGDSAMISITNATLCNLVAWAIDNDYLGNSVPTPQPRKPKPSPWA